MTVDLENITVNQMPETTCRVLHGIQMSRTGKPRDRRQMRRPGAGGGKEVTADGVRGLFLGWWKCFELDRGDGRTALSMY